MYVTLLSVRNKSDIYHLALSYATLKHYHLTYFSWIYTSSSSSSSALGRVSVPIPLLDIGLSHTLPHTSVLCFFSPVRFKSMKIIMPSDILTTSAAFVVSSNPASSSLGPPIVLHSSHVPCLVPYLLANVF